MVFVILLTGCFSEKRECLEVKETKGYIFIGTIPVQVTLPKCVKFKNQDGAQSNN
jgi:hypothetical protein